MHAGRSTTFTLIALLGCCAPASGVERGESLGLALEALRREGLQVIFSSALVRPELHVDVDPGEGSPEEIARRILAPHGLALRSVRPGLFSVVRAAPGASERAPATPGSASSPATPDSGEPLYEVDVYASRYVIDQSVPEASLATISRDELQALPGLNEDVLRATRFMPGTASSPVTARPHVRGGREDEVALFFDDAPLFEPFHYKDVQGLLGILAPETISRVDFFSGVFPAQYGNRLSGVLDIAPRTGSPEGYNAIGASVLYTHAITQGRMASRPIEWLASIRRGNLDLVTELTGRESETEPHFLDALARVQADVGTRNTLTAGFLLLDDFLRANLDGGAERGDFDYRDSTAWVGWRLRATDTTELHTTVSRTERHTHREGTLNRDAVAVGTLSDRRAFDTTTARVEGRFRLSKALSLNTGVEWYDYLATYDNRRTSAFDPEFAALFGRPTALADATALEVDGEAYAAYASASLAISRRVQIDAALRWDAQRFGTFFKDDQVSPRFSAQYQLDPATLIRLSWGRMAQTQRPDELQVSDGEPGFHPAQRSTQTVLGIERQAGPRAFLRLEAYNRRVTHPAPAYENLLDPFALLPELEVDRVRVDPDTTRLYGIELSSRWQWNPFWSSWLSYTWSEATDHFGGTPVLRTWDQKHSVASGVAWTRAPWQLSANLDWHSGWRRNSVTATPSGLELAPRNADAWPDYFSLDVRASWLRPLSSGVLEVTAEIDNLTNRGNPCCVSYVIEPLGGLAASTSTWLPRIYLLGVTWQLP
ncbi:MAG: TonB-dependent receptor [Steroidobacteraceae bacterium]|nr:TonB-dependent receptor [Steroidobacteraceae bacterium]